MAILSEIFGYVLNFFYNLVNNYGFSIIIFSFLLRLLLIPITIKQQKAMKKSAKLQEKMKEIQEKYKNNPEKLNQETMALYKSEKMSPFSGCLSPILQLLIILSVFWLVSQPLTYMKRAYKSEDTKQIMEEYKQKIEEDGSRKNYPEIQIISRIEEDYNKINEKLGQEEKEESTETVENQDNDETQAQTEINETEENNENQEILASIETMSKDELQTRKEILEKLRINMNFLGLDLSKVPTQNLSDWKVYIIPILYVLTSFISIRLTTNAQKSKNKQSNEAINDLTEEGKENNKTDEMQESMDQMNKSMSYMMPIMSISIACIAPLGLALYWFVSNILIIIERLTINKFIGSKEEQENE